MDRIKYLIIVLFFFPSVAFGATDIVNDANLGDSTLAACYELDETDGVRADSTSNGYDLSDQGNVQDVAGIIGRAADFNGTTSNNYLFYNKNATTDLLNMTGDFSISAWFVTNDETARQWFVNAHGGSAEPGYWMEYNNNFTLGVRDGTGASESAIAFTPTDDVRYHLFAMFDDSANDWELWIDGVSQGTASITKSPASSTESFRLGTQQTGVVTWQGNIDVFAIWRADKSAYVSDLYASGSGIPCVSAGGGGGEPEPPQDVINFWLISYLQAPPMRMTYAV